MSRYFPHAQYAEDQPLARTILNTHVATRAVTMGSIIGASIATGRHLLASRAKPSASTASATAVPPAPRTPLTPRLLRASGTGVVVSLAISGVLTAGRMYGREHIEWQDRSWRLMENKGQLETDDWTYIGMVAGPAVAAATGAGAGLGWRGVVGAGGLGSIVGMVGYLGWRYGVKGGFEVAKQEVAEMKA